MKSFACLIAVLLPLSFSALADQGHHHEEMTAEQLGTVHFPFFVRTVCADAV